MALKQLTYDVIGTVQCGPGGPEMEAGDAARIYLDQVNYPGFPEYVNGVVQMPVLTVQVHDPGCDCLVEGRRYIIEYESDDLLGVSPLLEDCHVDHLECTTCCEVLDEKYTAEVARIDAKDAEQDGRLDTLEAEIDKSTSDHVINASFNPATGLPVPSGIVGDDADIGDQLRVLYDPDSTPDSGDEWVVLWTRTGAGWEDPMVVEYPMAQVVKVETPPASGIYTCTFTDKLGNTVQWIERPVTASSVTSAVDAQGINTLTHDDGLGNTRQWISVDPHRVLFHAANIVSDNLEVTLWDPTADSGNGAYVTKYIPISDTP